MKITIIDYDMGNVGSILNMINFIGFKAKITNNPKEIMASDKIILPGVGSFDEGIKNLKKNKLIDIINEKVLIKKTPILGICLGFQLMTKSSEEGRLSGLGWLDANTIKFDSTKNRIPHMGWNTINIQKNHILLNKLNKKETKFYFVHSYYVACNNSSDILTTTNYGLEFTSSIQKENIFGVQFHPEKSHKYGIQLFNNFLKL